LFSNFVIIGREMKKLSPFLPTIWKAGGRRITKEGCTTFQIKLLCNSYQLIISTELRRFNIQLLLTSRQGSFLVLNHSVKMCIHKKY
jgi:hypothetical protein